jgi:elongation factor Ts
MEITAAMVKELREKTAAGMMDCKKALQENGGDMEKSIDYLRKKGLSAAAKKSSRATNEGIIASYIHSNHRVGVMMEVNCETDFVARNEKFAEMVHNLCLQVAAASPRWVRREDVPAAILDKEREIYRDQMKESGKPAQVIDKIVEGKLEKFYKDSCLVDQEYIKEAGVVIKDYVASVIATIGENLQIRRFVRFQVGEE